MTVIGALLMSQEHAPTLGQRNGPDGTPRRDPRPMVGRACHHPGVELLAAGLGLTLIALVAWDLFQTVVVPRPTPGHLRIARYTVRGSWQGVKWLGRRVPVGGRDTLFGLFGPGATILLLAVWLALLIVGFGLVFYALRDQLSPVPQNLGGTMYFAATSLLTIGYGDFVPTGAVTRLLAVISATGGLGAVALVVTFLFSLYGSYQRRELAVVTL